MSLTLKLQELISRAATDHKLRSMLRHNMNIFHTIHVSQLLANRHPLNFDMRADLWWRLDTMRRPESLWDVLKKLDVFQDPVLTSAHFQVINNSPKILLIDPCCDGSSEMKPAHWQPRASINMGTSITYPGQRHLILKKTKRRSFTIASPLSRVPKTTRSPRSNPRERPRQSKCA